MVRNLKREQRLPRNYIHTRRLNCKNRILKLFTERISNIKYRCKRNRERQVRIRLKI